MNATKSQIIECNRLYIEENSKLEEGNYSNNNEVFGKIHIEKSPVSRDELQVSKEFYILLNTSIEICHQQIV